MNRKQRRVEARLGQRGRATGGAAAPIARWFGAALAHQRGGRAAEAERVCSEILSVAPGHAQTLHLLGLIEPDDIANMALYLASDESRMVTGQVLPVDSGVTIS